MSMHSVLLRFIHKNNNIFNKTVIQQQRILTQEFSENRFNNKNMEYDLIIVGSGSVGAAAGYYSRIKGLKVLMIDQGHPPHDIGSHHGETRLIRHAYAADSYIPLVLKATQLWNELQTKSNKKIFENTGVLAMGPKDSTFMSTMRKSSEKWKLGVELEPKELTNRWPQIKVPSDFVALLESNSGVLYSENAVECYVDLSKQAGADQLFGCSVTKVLSLETGVAVKTTKGRFTGKKLLVSAGTWAQKLLPQIPIQPSRVIVSWWAADEKYSFKNGFPAFISELNGGCYYGFPAQNGELKIGRHDAMIPIASHEERVPFGDIKSDKEEALPFLKECFPDVNQCLRGVSCTYDQSSDGDFIIDTVDERKQILVVSGLSGHGFKFTSVLGDIASRFAVGVDSGFDLTPFSLKRFS